MAPSAAGEVPETSGGFKHPGRRDAGGFLPGCSAMLLGGVEMSSGGARNRSGPAPRQGSGRSEQRGYRLDALPAAGYSGPIPEFPLADASPAELELWAEAWRTPQGCAWITPSEHWRWRTVALWVRTRVRCEDPKAPATLLSQLHRLADQVGMTTAGLAEMGWHIKPEIVAVESVSKPDDQPAPVRRLRG